MSVILKSPKVAFIIPALNEYETIANVVGSISKFGIAIVVDDGSVDETGVLARAAGARVVRHELNLGYDSALATGLAVAFAEGFDFAITVDGDGQHDTARIEIIINELLDGADLVVGVRDKFQRISEKLFAFVSWKLWGIKDPLCGLKGYCLNKFKAVDCRSSYPSIGTEIAIRAARSGWDIRQVSIMTRNRNGNSRIGSVFKANWLILRSLFLSFIYAPSFSKDRIL